ncbi:hypothetical protein WT53_00960 [Burkholderia sp. MSMB2157WGS]|nr:hypothetical protein WT53_00960 [Burkholderia sp. MSMB2157WGS]
MSLLIQLGEVNHRERPTRKLDKPTFVHTAEIDRRETEANDQIADGFLCIGILSGQEQHASTTVNLGARGQRPGTQMIERLHNPCSRRPLRDQFAGSTTAKIDSMERRYVVGTDSYFYRIVCVD